MLTKIKRVKGLLTGSLAVVALLFVSSVTAWGKDNPMGYVWGFSPSPPTIERTVGHLHQEERNPFPPSLNLSPDSQRKELLTVAQLQGKPAQKKIVLGNF